MSLVDGARQALPVGVACAVVGVIIGVLTLTGAASNFAGFIIGVGEKSLFLSLVLDDARLPHPRHGHPDHPQLHHHQRHRRPGAVASWASR